MAVQSEPPSPSSSSRLQIPRKFRELFTPGWRDFAAHGGRGGAKSHSIAGALVVQAAQEPLRIVCAREIQNSLRDSVKQLIEDKIAAAGLGGHFESLEAEIRGRNGSRFVFKGMWRNPDAIKSLEGADVFWGEEANRFSARSIRLIRPTLRKPGSRMIWSWNPEFDHDPIDKLMRGPAGPPPATADYPLGSIVREVSHLDNPWFADSPLQAEMENDYRVDSSMAAHVWGGEYISAIEGAYFAQQIDAATREGRITSVPKDPILRPWAVWDIGVNDATAIWVVQLVGLEIRVLDYIQGSGQALGYYVNELRSRGYGGALCVLPHDGAQRDPLTAVSYEDHVSAAGFETRLIKNQGRGAAMLRVEAARRLFPRCLFNDETTRDGRKSLAAYHERRDDRRNVGYGPEHDWASHGADAFGLMCVAYEEPKIGPQQKFAMPDFGHWGG